MEINNNIKERYCSFEIAKLLREKGLLLNTSTRYVINYNGKYPWQKEGAFLDLYDHLDESCSPNHNIPDDKLIDAPTQSLAIKWIKNNIEFTDIWVKPSFSKNPKLYEVHIWYRGDTQVLSGYDSEEEAIESALLYTLNNLI